MNETQIDSLVLRFSLCENELQASESWVRPGNEANHLTRYRINRMLWESFQCSSHVVHSMYTDKRNNIPYTYSYLIHNLTRDLLLLKYSSLSWTKFLLSLCVSNLSFKKKTACQTIKQQAVLSQTSHIKSVLPRLQIFREFYTHADWFLLFVDK